MENKTIKDIDIFNQIKNHLLEQNEKSLGVLGGCAYRGITQDDLDTVWGDVYETPPPLIKNCHIWSLETTNAVLDMRDEITASLKCAVGCIINDDFYISDLEENSVAQKHVRAAVINSNLDWKFEFSSEEMLTSLQRLHDQYGVDEWPSVLESFKFDGSGKFFGPKHL